MQLSYALKKIYYVHRAGFAAKIFSKSFFNLPLQSLFLALFLSIYLSNTGSMKS